MSWQLSSGCGIVVCIEVSEFVGDQLLVCDFVVRDTYVINLIGVLVIFTAFSQCVDCFPDVL